MIVITFRCGKQLEEHKGSDEGNLSEKENPPSEVVEEEKEKPYVSPPSYKPTIPFTERFAKTDTLSQMPSYAKFLKEILSKKRNIDDNELVALAEECNAIIQNKLPPKLKDPRSLSLPCVIVN